MNPITRHRLLLTAALAACLYATSALAALVPPERLTVVTDINFPPYLFEGDGGELQGILKDKWALWSERTGVPVVLKGMEWKKAQQAVLEGEADIIEALSYTAARSQLYEYSRPYAPIDARIYFHRTIAGINDVPSLRGFRIGAKEGSACAAWLSARGLDALVPYPSSEALIKAAGAGDVRLFCMDSPAAQYFLFKQGLADEFRQTAPLYTTHYHWALVKGRADLRDLVQAGFDRIGASRLEEIDSRWLGNPLRFPIGTQYVYYLALAALGVAVSAVLLLLWNRGLRRQVTQKTSDLSAAYRSLEEMNASLERTVGQRTAELKRANDELQGALDHLRTAQNLLVNSEKLAALGRLVAGVAHELNTPIGNSLLSATTLSERTEEFAQAANGGLRRTVLDTFVADSREAADILRRNLEKAGNLISSFKQISADQASSQRRGFQLHELIEEVLLAHRPMLRKTPFTTLSNIPPNIHLDSYPGPLGQVLGNLVLNAVQHGYDGHDRGAVIISARASEGDCITLMVRDEGRGIPKHDLPRVFEPFFTTRLGRGGTGLGLSISYSIVTQVLGGEIKVESTVGSGTAVTLKLPLRAPASHPELDAVHRHAA